MNSIARWLVYKLVAVLTPQDKGLPLNVDGKVIPW